MDVIFFLGWVGFGLNYKVISIYIINMFVLLYNEMFIYKILNNVGLVLVKLYDIFSNYFVFFGNFN